MELKLLFILSFVAVAQCKLIPLNCPLIKLFVDGHNARRLLVARGKVPGQPAAAEMKRMSWDVELAWKATMWARQHLHRHDTSKSVGSKRFIMGENTFDYSTTNPIHVLEPEIALASWFSENVNFTFGPLEKSHFNKDYDIGHYTQMVWSDSIYLGCAISHSTNGKWQRFYVVCTYGPGGSYLGEKPYKESNKGSNQLVCGNKKICDRPYGPTCVFIN